VDRPPDIFADRTGRWKLAAQFAERRQQLLAENLANVDVPIFTSGDSIRRPLRRRWGRR